MYNVLRSGCWLHLTLRNKSRENKDARGTTSVVDAASPNT